jgi:hypothetical protein
MKMEVIYSSEASTDIQTISQKMGTFITIAVRTSNPTNFTTSKEIKTML